LGKLRHMGLFSRFGIKSKESKANKANDANKESKESKEDTEQVELSGALEESLSSEFSETDEFLGVSQERPVSRSNGPSWFARVRENLFKTRQALGASLGRLILGKKQIDAELLEEIETILLSADVGLEATNALIASLTQEVERKILKDPEKLLEILKEKLVEILKPVEQSWVLETQKKPFVLLVVGVNGAGKTTSIGKLAKKFQNEGRTVLLAAGDTFRAAAVEQLKAWGDKNQVEVVAQGTGADSASVIFDALSRAKARNIDVVIADTAGRLHNKQNLMMELNKITRVMQKFDPTAPHETMLILDATLGQNALVQAEEFKKSAHISSLSVTKLDGTAKGGVLFALAKKLNLPVRFIGVGEGIDDLKNFDAKLFVEALF